MLILDERRGDVRAETMVVFLLVLLLNGLSAVECGAALVLCRCRCSKYGDMGCAKKKKKSNRVWL